MKRRRTVAEVRALLRLLSATQPPVPEDRQVIWELSDRADPAARVLADRHYNRQKVGSAQFVPPGRCLVLKAPSAFWITSWPFAEFVKHAWAGAWVCSAFRNEGSELSSQLIRDAISVTRWRFGDAPEIGMVTFVDRDKVRHKRDPGRCFLRAGFENVGETKGGLVALRILPASMPSTLEPSSRQGVLWSAPDA